MESRTKSPLLYHWDLQAPSTNARPCQVGVAAKHRKPNCQENDISCYTHILHMTYIYKERESVCVCVCVCARNYGKQVHTGTTHPPKKKTGKLNVSKLKQRHMTHAWAPCLLAITLLRRVEQIYCEIGPLKSDIEVSIGRSSPQEAA